MHCRHQLIAWVAVALLGCGDDDRPAGDGGSAADGGTGADASAECTVVATTCPEEIPAQAAPCETGLSCDYGEPGGNEWRYDCEDGLWVATNTFCAHDGICVPPLIQRCSAPFAGTLDGASVEIGPWAGPARSFETDEVVPLVWGPQGGAMVPFRVQVTGDGVPDCVAARVEATVDGTAGAPATLPVAMTCGLSAPVLFIVPVECAGEAERALDLTVQVEGIGEASASVTLTGGDQPCTR